MSENQFSTKGWILGFVIATALVSPAAVWIALDRSPFGGDQSEYATRTLILFRALITSPSQWAALMVTGEGFRPPGIAWVGQFFVPLGYLIGSIDRGLLCSILAVQFISLILLFRLIWEISDGSALCATLGCLVVAAAPLFVGLSQNYMVEPLQTLSVIWLFLIMALSARWGRALIVGQLAGAVTLAMLAKASSPLYCFAPAFVALRFAFGPGQSDKRWGWRDTDTVLTLAAAVPLSVACTIWYGHNYRSVIAHVAGSSFGPMAAVWGKNDTFVNSLVYWLRTAQRGFFSTDRVGMLVVVICVAGGIYCLLKRKHSVSHFRLYYFVVILQLAVPFGAFAQASNRLSRVLLASLPCCSILFCLIMSEVNRRILTGLLAGIFAFQFGSVHAQNLTIVRRNATGFMRPIDRDGKAARVIESIVSRTCTGTDQAIVNVLAVDPTVKGDWLAPVPANYVVERDLVTGTAQPPCKYEYIGNSFFGRSAGDAWDGIVTRNVRYVIITDPAVYPPRANAINRTLTHENLPVVLQHLENSRVFKPAVRLPEDPGILIFERHP